MFFVALVMGTENIAADATVAIDGDADGHVFFPASGCGSEILKSVVLSLFDFTATVLFAQLRPWYTR